MPARKVQVVWNTGPGGSGLSTFYTLESVDATVEIGTFFNAIKSLLSDTISISVPASGDTIEVTNGHLSGAWVGGTAATYTGTAHSAYAAGTGAFVKWLTSGIAGTHRVRGRTFICPLLVSGFDVDGTLSGSYVTAIQNAANTLAASGKLNIWHRPSAPGAVDGSLHTVIAAQVPDKVTSLATRRH